MWPCRLPLYPNHSQPSRLPLISPSRNIVPDWSVDCASAGGSSTRLPGAEITLAAALGASKDFRQICCSADETAGCATALSLKSPAMTRRLPRSSSRYGPRALGRAAWPRHIGYRLFRTGGIGDFALYPLGSLRSAISTSRAAIAEIAGIRAAAYETAAMRDELRERGFCNLRMEVF
jgi:hypothetical protein